MKTLRSLVSIGLIFSLTMMCGCDLLEKKHYYVSEKDENLYPNGYNLYILSRPGHVKMCVDQRHGYMLMGHSFLSIWAIGTNEYSSMEYESPDYFVMQLNDIPNQGYVPMCLRVAQSWPQNVSSTAAAELVIRSGAMNYYLMFATASLINAAKPYINAGLKALLAVGIPALING